MPRHLSTQLTRSIRKAFQQSLERQAWSAASKKESWTCYSCHIRPGQLRPYSNKLLGCNQRAQPKGFKRHVSNISHGQAVKETSPNETISASTSSALPSHTDRQRWIISKRWSSIMDSVLARASVAGQHINVYTGTDYSGIEALRQAIISKESEVRKQHGAVGDAKEEHARARTKQAASQKEIVGLLERKSSWTPSDLERYMTLVRSEHVDDQAVQKAAEELAAAERQLEATRSLLEKLERQQYHEEQIWSDTIRRNSTWVTIGLMGINIVLLLAQISIFEPYRRRKIVDQIEQALEERVASGVLISAAHPAEAEPAPPQTTKSTIVATSEHDGKPENADIPSSESFNAGNDGASPTTASRSTAQGVIQHIRVAARSLLSEQLVQMRQYDRTLLAVESAITGMGVAFVCSILMLKFG